MDERTEFLDDFDLLMENASHSYEIQYGDTKKRSRWGQLLWQQTAARKRASMPGQGFLAFAHWWSLE
ncbi:MAG TPA: hypothetical protein VGR76_07545 [Candidatus Angelobacter sp.]|jgi:hypothetical protein|nr:hypothetical protein [Candidatus Angelobacter sp.]